MCIQAVSNLCPQNFFALVTLGPSIFPPQLLLVPQIFPPWLLEAPLIARPDQQPYPSISYFAKHKQSKQCYVYLCKRPKRGGGLNPSHDIWAAWWVGLVLGWIL